MTHPTTRRAACLLGTLALLCMPSAIAAQGLNEALQGGKVSAQLRLVYEHNDTDNKTSAADAGTLRTGLGYRTGEIAESNALLEFRGGAASRVPLRHVATW